METRNIRLGKRDIHGEDPKILEKVRSSAKLTLTLVDNTCRTKTYTLQVAREYVREVSR